MRFSLVHKLASYLMVISAAAAIWFSPEISNLTRLISLLAIAGSWFVNPHRLPLERWTTFWNMATFAFLAYLVVDVLKEGDPIHAGIHFLLFVLVNKLYNRVTSKDYRQAYVVSFLLLVAATTLNTGLSYAVCFAAYVVSTIWALTLFHLRREMEENYLLRHAAEGQSEKVEVERVLNSRRIVGAPFLASTALVAVGVLISSALVFLAFPRVGFGLFLGVRRGGATMVGFSEKVELGQHGTIRDNPKVVMRVTFPGGRPGRTLYWRGSVYDHYQSGVWSQGADLAGRIELLQHDRGMFRVMHAPGLPRKFDRDYIKEHLLHQVIYLEPLDSNIIFAADRPVGLEVGWRAVGTRRFFRPARGALGEIRARDRGQAGVVYTAWSHPPSLSAAHLALAQPIIDARFERFLQVPANMPARVKELALRITRGKDSVHAKVVAVRKYLRATYPYTTTLTHAAGHEPVDEFLFETRRGHCEYYASAMGLLLRYAGVHTRQVNGFAAGAWNEYGQYLAVRHGDAHAWVEVLYSNAGWITVDPTPDGGARPAPMGGLLGQVSQMTDALRLRWFRYVVEYDLAKQLHVLRGVAKAFRQKGEGPGAFIRDNRTVWAVLGVALALAVVIWAWIRYGQRLLALLRRRRVLGSRVHAAAGLYGRLLALLARAGFDKAPGATPLEFAGDLEARQAPGADLVLRFTRLYYGVRFGGDRLGPEQQGALGELLGEIKQRLREANA